MSKKVKIIETADGSSSLYLEELNETYHSFHGALQESLHVFIQKGIHHLIEQGKNTIRIFEVGFGTGLNVILSLEEALKNPSLEIEFHTIEAYPLEMETIKALNYKDSLSEDAKKHFDLLHEKEWGTSHQILPNFSFTKYHQKLEDFSTSLEIDLVFYDAFAPSKQSEMWSLNTLNKASDLVTKDGVLVTYCAKGQFKRDLKELGFEVETLDGPPGKKQMVRGTKI